MSLGVLNNLNAMYASNSLNNTQSSLSKTLQQLSSGSKINSGADDAAGLSLVNGLAANSTALTQSATNATEGVGLLQVADGALSQVTNLLNRAVTLATEVSNGTLNTSQQAAANQEYQSILGEISNIGSTTTYNQNQVFGGTFSIYVGDSTTTLHRCTDQYAQLHQPGYEHPAAEHRLCAERCSGHRLRYGHVQPVQVRDPQPDRHLGSCTGQQPAAGSHQAPAVSTS